MFLGGGQGEVHAENHSKIQNARCFVNTYTYIYMYMSCIFCRHHALQNSLCKKSQEAFLKDVSTLRPLRFTKVHVPMVFLLGGGRVASCNLGCPPSQDSSGK